MPNIRILNALLYKEWLRYRYNWGLLSVVFALVFLSSLVSLSDRLRSLRNDAQEVKTMIVWHSPNSAWARELKKTPMYEDRKIEYREILSRPIVAEYPPKVFVAALVEPGEKDSRGNVRSAHFLEFFYFENDEAGAYHFRDFLSYQTKRYLGIKPFYEEWSHRFPPNQGNLDATKDPIPLVITALTVFGMYLCSFNIYMTSTGEEREKKILLAIVLTPASALEVILAKAIFYVAASLVVSGLVAGMHRPALVLVPWFWSTIALGACGYVAIGTILLCLVRRQTTINTLSMLYLIMTSIIMILSQVLPVFDILKNFLVENWLYSQLQYLISGKPVGGVFRVNQGVLAVLTAAWFTLAVVFFQRRGVISGRSH